MELVADACRIDDNHHIDIELKWKFIMEVYTQIEELKMIEYTYP
jgi:hypothetical protein